MATASAIGVQRKKRLVDWLTGSTLWRKSSFEGLLQYVLEKNEQEES